MSPRTHVRVMSAQQPEASSWGHRSRQIGACAGSGPLPASWPTASPGRMGATMMSSGAGAPRRAHTSRMRARSSSEVSTSPVEAQPVAVDLGLAQHARALLHARPTRRRPPGGCRPARRRSCWRRRSTKSSSSGVSSMPSARRRSATASGNVGRHDGRGDPELAHGAHVRARDRSARRTALGDQLVAAELLAEQALELRRRGGDAVDLEHVGQDRRARPSISR